MHVIFFIWRGWLKCVKYKAAPKLMVLRYPIGGKYVGVLIRRGKISSRHCHHFSPTKISNSSLFSGESLSGESFVRNKTFCFSSPLQNFRQFRLTFFLIRYTRSILLLIKFFLQMCKKPWFQY